MLNTVNSYSKANVFKNTGTENSLRRKKADTPVSNASVSDSQLAAAQRQQGIMGRVFCNISNNNQSSVNSLQNVNFCGNVKNTSNSDGNVSVSRNPLLTEKLKDKIDLDDLDDSKYVQFMNNPQIYGVSPIELQKIINTSFVETIDNQFSIPIDNRRILLPPSQKAVYDNKINNYTYDEKNDKSAKTIQDSHYGQVIMSDAMLIEAIAVNMGLDIDGKGSEEIFEILSEKAFDGENFLPDITFDGKDAIIEAFFCRDSLSEPIEYINDAKMGGDKAVHELCKSLCGNLEKNEIFQNKWKEYCNSSDKFKQYSALADTYKEIINNQLKTTYQISKPEETINNKIENLNHVIFRAIQRDCLFDFESMNWEDWENNLDIDALSFPYRLAEKIANDDNTEDFMGKIFTREGQDKFQTIEYNLPKGYSWADEAEYFPNVDKNPNAA